MLDQPLVERLEAEAVNSARVRQPLYVARKKIFPKRASGAFRRFKWQVMLVTLAIYYLTPWIRWDRGAHAPDQAVLVDIASRRFYFFFIEIWPQEFFFVAGLLVMAGIGLFLVTSTVGRAWCGYACPQTVWVDLFLVIERAVEGDRAARMRLDAAPWTANKIARRTVKHAIWLLIAVATGGAWIFYFADAPTLALDFARAASIKHNLPSVIFSLEMSRTEITTRLISAEAGIKLHSPVAKTTVTVDSGAAVAVVACATTSEDPRNRGASTATGARKARQDGLDLGRARLRVWYPQHTRDEERPAAQELGDMKPFLALADDVVRAVGRCHVAQDVGRRADAVEAVRGGVFLRRIPLQDDADRPLLAHGLLGALIDDPVPIRLRSEATGTGSAEHADAPPARLPHRFLEAAFLIFYS